jgi:hypothetical protein
MQFSSFAAIIDSRESIFDPQSLARQKKERTERSFDCLRQPKKTHGAKGIEHRD